MTNKKLISEVNKRLKKKGISTDIEKSKIIVDVVFDTMFNFLSLGHQIKIINFGTFRSNLETKILKNKKYKRYVLRFVASEKLKCKLNKYQDDGEEI